MSDTVFISGSIKIKTLPQDFIDSINIIVDKGMRINIGDAPGVDTKVQEYLFSINYRNVWVYHIGKSPRNNVGSFNLKKIDYKKLKDYINLSEQEKIKVEKSERLKQTYKDIEMENDANFLLVLWDGISNGSKNNIVKGLNNSKFVKVYFNRFLSKDEVTIENINNIFENNNGLNLSEIKKRLNDIIENKYHLEKDDIQNYNIDRFYPITLNKIENNYNIFQKYIIVKNFKGKKQYKYHSNIVNFLLKEYLNKFNEIKKDKSISLFNE